MAAVALGGALPHPVDDRVVAALDAVPAVVAVHREVAPADRRDGGIRVGGRRAAPSRSAMNGRAERGGVSRPSSSAWTRTLAHALAAGQLGQRDEMAVVGVDAARSDEADDAAGRRRSRGPGRRRRGRPGASKNEPSAMAASIRGRSWRTGRPAPRFRCPTSELPIWPGWQADGILGRPERGVRPAREQAAPGGHRGGRDGVRRPDRHRSRSHRGRRGRSVADDSRGGESGAGGQPGPGHDPGHLIGLERCPADERAVDGWARRGSRRCSRP